MADIFADEKPIFPESRNDQWLEKPLPSSEESERVIISAILFDENIIHEVSPYLNPSMFYSPLHRRIYAAMEQIAYGDIAYKKIDPITIGEVLKMEGSLESIGGITTITNLTFGLPYFKDIDEYVQVVKGKAAVRSRIRLCNTMTGQLLAEEDTPDVVLQQTEKMFLDHVETDGHTVVSNVSDMEASMIAFNKKIVDWKSGKSTSIPSPFPLLNRRLNERGYSMGDLSIIAARPSDGKTTFTVQNAFHCARHFYPALFISLEMSREDIFQKIVSGEARVPNYRINEDLFLSMRGDDKDMVERIKQAEKNIRTVPFYIDDDSQTLTSIMGTMMEYVVKKKVRFIGIDYAQIVRNDISEKKMQTRDREIGEIVERFKWFAKKETKTKEKVHVQLCVQLKRLKGQSPTADDLRESGSLEQIADLILAPYGEKPKEEVVLRDMKLLCLKQRKGRPGWQLPITLHGDWQRFYDKQNLDDDIPAINTSLALFSKEESEF